MHCRRFLLSALAILTISFALAFIIRVKEKRSEEHTANHSLQTVSQTTAVPVAARSPMEEWLGRWEFSECWPMLQGVGANCIQYEMNISNEGARTIADLDAVGFQTDSHVRGIVKLKKDGIKIVYVKVRESGLFDDAYKAGDGLFDLSSQNGKIVTTWEKLKPALDKNKSEGMRFERVN